MRMGWANYCSPLTSENLCCVRTDYGRNNSRLISDATKKGKDEKGNKEARARAGEKGANE